MLITVEPNQTVAVTQPEHDGPAAGDDGRSRRRFLTGAGAATAVALAGCLGGGDGGDGGGGGGYGTGGSNTASSITVSVYGGAYGNVFEETVAAAYEEETGTTVNVAKAWSERVAKLRSAAQGGGSPPYDLIGLSGFNYLSARNEELVQPVRYENVPNAEKVWPYFRNVRTDEFGVPGEGGVLGIIYKPESEYAESWEGFMTTDAPAGMNGGYWKNPITIAAQLSDEMPGTQELYEPAAHEAVFDTLEKLSANVAKWYSGGADVWTALDGGTIDYGAFYYASGLAGIDNRPEKNYEMLLPDVTPGYFTNFCVTNTDKRDEAERFLDFMLRTEVQQAWNENGYYIPANREVAGSYAERLQGLYPETNEELAEFMIVGDYEALSEYKTKLSDRFTQITTA
jgi:spermidine/putrescine transport system substrate-binding protein